MRHIIPISILFLPFSTIAGPHQRRAGPEIPEPVAGSSEILADTADASSSASKAVENGARAPLARQGTYRLIDSQVDLLYRPPQEYLDGLSRKIETIWKQQMGDLHARARRFQRAQDARDAEFPASQAEALAAFEDQHKGSEASETWAKDKAVFLKTQEAEALDFQRRQQKKEARFLSKQQTRYGDNLFDRRVRENRVFKLSLLQINPSEEQTAASSHPESSVNGGKTG